MNKFNKKGFTLIEMLVVIAIIAVLVSIIIPVVGDSTAKARAAADAANLRSFAATIAIDYMDNQTVDGTNYTAPTAKTKDAGACSVYMINNEVKAFFGNNGVDYFAAIAEGKTATAATTAPTGTKLWPKS